MPKVSLNFKGLMAPVFTGFNYDKDKSVNTDNIDEYAVFLKNNGITGVLVNGTSGEGPILSVPERKLITESWSIACKKHEITLMVQIGGAPLCDVIGLAKHCQQLKVDSILCLPELYFKPKTIEDLVTYLKSVSQYCPEIPFLYYHIPMFTGLTLHMPAFCDIAEKQIPNFVGLKYTSGDLDQGADCLKPGRNVFLGADTILSGALVLGFDSAIMTTLNICPELSLKIMSSIENGKLPEAREAQEKLTARVKEILKIGGGEWVPSMKLAFNNMKNGLNCGPTRVPARD